jgi:hypothetical protein
MIFELDQEVIFGQRGRRGVIVAVIKDDELIHQWYRVLARDGVMHDLPGTEISPANTVTSDKSRR